MITDKVAIVTGSTSGIGQAMARALAENGVHVVLNGFGDIDQIEQDRSALEKETGRTILYHGADMTRPEEIEDLVKSTASKLGSVDIIVNNAGVQYVSKIEEFPTEKWDQIIAINLSSAFHTIKHAVPYMRTNKWGRIINLASAHALVASPFKSAYVAAKHGIAGMTKSIALETAQDGITVNAICPGYVKTALVENQIGDTAKTRGISEEDVINNVILAAQPSKQFTTVDQIGALCVFLCSDAGANITGSMLPMDGGWTAQ